MKKHMIFYVLLALLFSQLALAGTGLFFNIVSTGNPVDLDIVLCLNGRGPLTCQHYKTSALNLTINTTVPGHVYREAGIKINTPGYFPMNCTPISNGYCLFSASDSVPANINIGSTSTFTLGGAVSGLSGTVVLQNNGMNSTSISTNGNFTFASPVADQSVYNVTVETQPSGQICTVTDGSGVVNGADVTNIGVNCVTQTTNLSVPARSTIPVNNGTSTLTVTNTGTNTAFNVSASLPGSWTEVIQGTCPSIAPNGGTCNLTFSSTRPYVAQGNISIIGDNITGSPSTALAFTVNGYLVWSVPSSNTALVIAAGDLPITYTWDGNITQTAIAGINEDSVSPPDACNGATDGACDSVQMVNFYGVTTGYVAGNCYGLTSDNTGSIPMGTWYQPSVCQLIGPSGFPVCPSVDSINVNLFQLGFGGLQSNYYWSSTQVSGDPVNQAWYVRFQGGGGTNAGQGSKTLLILYGRCARSLTF